MKKKFTNSSSMLVVIVFCFFTQFLSSAVNYNISFSATGYTGRVQNVEVKNLTKNTVVYITEGNFLNLVVNTTGLEENTNDQNQGLLVCPEANEGQFKLTFLAKNDGNAHLDVFRMDGRKQLDLSQNLAVGMNSFLLSLPKGIFVVKVSGNGYSYSTKVVNSKGNNIDSQISFVENKAIDKQSNLRKAPTAGQNMAFSIGDELRFKGYADGYADVVTVSPTGSMRVNFYFINYTCGAYIAQGIWKEFLCHNLGANIELDPFTYNEGINGDLYQWGRPADGHQSRTSRTTSILSESNTPGHSNFILAANYPFDWVSALNQKTRWSNPKTANDPCPTGFRVPTLSEWSGVATYNLKSTWEKGYTFGPCLYLPAAGVRDASTGVIDQVETLGIYWSSTGVFTDKSNNFLTRDGELNSADKASTAAGLSVRCIIAD